MRKIIIPIFAYALVSCGGGEASTTESAPTDSTQMENTVDTTTNQEMVDENLPDPNISAENSSIEAFEKKAGGMSFCDCVKKQKELDDKMMATDDDTEIEALLAESEKMRNGECAVLKAGPQMTAAEKRARENKVNECLNQK